MTKRTALALGVVLSLTGGGACGGRVEEQEPAVRDRVQTSAPLPVADASTCRELASGTYSARKVRKKGGDDCGPVRFDTTVVIGPSLPNPEWTCTTNDDAATCTLDETCSRALDDSTLISRQKYVTSGEELTGWSEWKEVDLEGRVVAECAFAETLTPVP